MAALAAIGAALLRNGNDPAPPPPTLRLAFPVPSGAELGAGADLLDAAISPDERSVVFVATTAGIPRLWLRTLDTEPAQPLPGTDGASLPAWKRGGGVVSFFAGGALKQIALADRAVSHLAAAPQPGGAAWMADGSLVFAPAADGPLQRLARGVRSNATSLRPGERGHLFPTSADGSALIYVAVAGDGRRSIRLLSGGNDRELAPTSAHAQLVDGQLVHIRDGILVAQRLDPETMMLTGRAAALSSSAAISASGHGSFAASPRLLLAAPAVPRVREIVWFDEAGQRLTTVGEPGDLWQVRLSPDDRHVAVTLVDPLLKTLDIVTMPTGRPGDRERLTLALATDTDPVWSPDGAEVIFRSLEDAKPALFWRRAHDSTAPLEGGTAIDRDETPTDWRGNRVLVTSAAGGRSDIHTVDRSTGVRTPVAATGFAETDARWSPDGRSIALVSDESGAPDVYVVAAATAATPRLRVSFAGGIKPRWSADGRALFFLRGDEVQRADRQGDRFTSPRRVAVIPGIRDFDVAHRSRRLLTLLAAPGPPVITSTVVDWAAPLPALQSSPRR